MNVLLIDPDRPRVQLRTERFTPQHSHMIDVTIEHGGFVIVDGQLYCVREYKPLGVRSLEWAWELSPARYVGQA